MELGRGKGRRRGDAENFLTLLSSPCCHHEAPGLQSRSFSSGSREGQHWRGDRPGGDACAHAAPRPRRGGGKRGKEKMGEGCVLEGSRGQGEIEIPQIGRR